MLVLRFKQIYYMEIMNMEMKAVEGNFVLCSILIFSDMTDLVNIPVVMYIRM
jgi:hypothetical protein